MKLKLTFLYLLIGASLLNAQNGFNFESNKNKISLPFQLINNLIILPVEVNGVSLNFLLDTGVEESILFSLDETDEISFSQVEKIKIKGFGNKESFDGYKSVDNKLKCKDYQDINHTLYLVLDQEINMSSQIGVPVNGILGHHFFKNNLIKIDYESQKITIFRDKEKQTKKIKVGYSEIPLTFDSGKPYLNSEITFSSNQKHIETKLLLDIGNSDAVWLFKDRSDQIVLPDLTFDDFLGRGFGGDVFGKRGRVATFQLSDFEFKNTLVAFPESLANSDIEFTEGRLGSVGSEIIRRFDVYFDYSFNKLYLKKNSHFGEPFNFNMSGIEIQHQGLKWVKEAYEEKPAVANNLVDVNGEKIAGNLRYKFELKPVYIISNVRKDSPAALAGLKKDDVIVKINKQEGYNFTLQEINELLKSEEGKTIQFEIERNGVNMKFKFQLKSLL